MGREHFAATFAETDRDVSLALAAGAEDDLVAVLEEAPGLAGGQLHRLLAASGDLQQRAELAGLGAGRVPEPNRSPGCNWQPLTLWWATICATVQYMLRLLLRVRRCGGRPFSRRPSVSSRTSSSMSKAPWAWSLSS